MFLTIMHSNSLVIIPIRDSNQICIIWILSDLKSRSVNEGDPENSLLERENCVVLSVTGCPQIN